MRVYATGAVVVLAALPGCTGMTPRLGFDDVAQEVDARAGVRTRWNDGSPGDAAAEEAVGMLLAGELTADGAVQVALLNNRGLQGVYEELDIAQADVVQAGLLRNPVFGAEFRFASGGGGTGVNLDVAQDFISLLSMGARRGRAGAAFEAAKVRVTRAVLDAAFETRTAFYDHQAAEQASELRATVAEATGVSLELARRLRAAGNTTDLELFNERAMHEQAKVDLAAAETGVARTRERMNALMGLWGARTTWRAAGRLPAVPAEALPEGVDERGLETRAIGASLDLALLGREAEIAARSAGIARPFAWLDGAEVGAAAEREIEGGWSAGPAFALPIPLFDQGQAVVGAAEARYRQAAARAHARAVEIRARARAAGAEVESAHARARYYGAIILPLRERIVEETQLQYNAMQVSAFQLLQARRDQVEAGAAYVEAVRGYWVARAVLDSILQGGTRPFEGGAGGVDDGSMGATPASAGAGDHG